MWVANWMADAAAFGTLLLFLNKKRLKRWMWRGREEKEKYGDGSGLGSELINGNGCSE